jgi:hypothetical protein
MTYNSKAKAHYDDAVNWLQAAATAATEGQTNSAVIAAQIAEASTRLASFCVENHALVMGIDDEAPVNPQQVPGGVKLWGGPK